MKPQRPWTFSNLKKGEGLQAGIDFIIERGMLGVRG
jgi:urease accessory protein